MPVEDDGGMSQEPRSELGLELIGLIGLALGVGLAHRILWELGMRDGLDVVLVVRCIACQLPAGQ